MLMAVGRNEPCPCGSGKKFKKCHGKNGSKSFRTEATKEVSSPVKKKNNFFRPTETPRQVIDTKAFVKDRLEKLMTELKRPRPDGDVVKFLNSQLHQLDQKGNLTQNEYRLIKEIALSNAWDYARLPFGDTPDYGAFNIYFELAQQAITERITDEQQYYSVTVYVGPGDTLVKWELSTSYGWRGYRDNDAMNIVWKDTDELPEETMEPSQTAVDPDPVPPIRQSPYRFDVGIEEFIAGYLDLISMEIENTSRDWYLTDLIGDIRPFSKVSDASNLEDLKEMYLIEVEITLSVRNDDDQWDISWSNATQSVKEPYKPHLFTKLKIVDYILDEVKNYTKKTPDAVSKETILLYLEFTKNVLVQNYEIDEVVNKPFIVIFTDEKQNIIDFTITESNQFTKIECYTFQEQSANISATKKEMSRQGQLLLISAQRFDSLVPDQFNEEFDFSPFCLSYFKALEQELQFHYGAIVLELVPKVKKRDLTIGKFTWAFKEIFFKNKAETLNITEPFLVKLERVREIRNLSAHLDPVSYGMYEEVRSLFVDNQFLDEVLSLGQENGYKFTYSNRIRESLLNKLLDTQIEVPALSPYMNLDDLVPNRYAALKKLEDAANLYFKVPFQGTHPIMDGRILVTEIDHDSLGYLLLKEDATNRKGFWGHQFDYIGHNVFADRLDLQFGNMMDSTRGIISLMIGNGIIHYKGNVAAKKMKRKVLSNIFSSKEDFQRRMMVLIEDINKEAKVDFFYQLLSDFYLLLVGANENQTIKTPNLLLLEKFLTTVLAEYHHIQITRLTLLSIVREFLLMTDMKEDVANFSTFKIEVSDGQLTLTPLSSTSQDEIIFVVSDKELQVK
ncbi:YecA family protein [Neobacillus niacini]|uniref:YecA family protein n=1 Tax=Neobacillus niacini TaxID=86668 RepID=UPI003B58702C